MSLLLRYLNFAKNGTSVVTPRKDPEYSGRILTLVTLNRQWGYPDSNGHLPYDYNTKVCLTPDAGHDCIKLSGAEDHKVNRFYLATGLYVAVYRYIQVYWVVQSEQMQLTH